MAGEMELEQGPSPMLFRDGAWAGLSEKRGSFAHASVDPRIAVHGRGSAGDSPWSSRPFCPSEPEVEPVE